MHNILKLFLLINFIFIFLPLLLSQCTNICICSNYQHDESKNSLGSNRCSKDCDCAGTRMCSIYGYCHDCDYLKKCPAAIIPCPLGEYWNNVNCSKCGSFCESCKDEKSCLKCNSPRVLLNSICVCPQGTYLDIEKKLCVNCPVNCLECESASKCLNCDVDYNLIESLCFPATYYDPAKKQCKKCASEMFFNTTTNMCDSLITCKLLSCYQSSKCSMKTKMEETDEFPTYGIIMIIIFPIFLLILIGIIIFCLKMKKKKKEKKDKKKKNKLQIQEMGNQEIRLNEIAREEKNVLDDAHIAEIIAKEKIVGPFDENKIEKMAI